MKNKFVLLALIVVLGAAILVMGGQPATAQAEALLAMPVDQIIIKYQDGANLNAAAQAQASIQMQRLNEAAGVTIDYFRPMSGNAHVLKLSEAMPVDDALAMTARLSALPEVEYAEPDYLVFAMDEPSEMPFVVPNDTRYTEQWHYFDTYGVNAPAAWDITKGASNVYIAVLDTGITDHADLSGRWVGGYDMISDSRFANDGNGRDANPHDPGDWITSAENSSGFFEGCGVTDSSWHGTHVAGTIGAASNNGLGVAGLNWVSKVVPVRVLGKCGNYSSDIADGIRWAAGVTVDDTPANAYPAQVINMSLGGYNPDGCSDTYQNAINAAYNAGSVIVVSAGNSNYNANAFQPASCNNVVTVAATDHIGDRAYYSNYGATVEISAPGGDTSVYGNGVLSTLNTGTQGPVADTYTYYQGTSMAAPHISGVASLMYSLNPSLTPAQVLAIMQSTATAFPGGSSCNTSTCGTGIVNAAAALAAVPGATPGVPILSAISNSDGVGSFTVDWNDVANADSYTLQEADNSSFSSPITVYSGAASQYNVTGKTGGNWYYRVRATNDAGDSAWSNTKYTIVKPDAPILDAIDNPGYTDAYTITWSSSGGADGYLLQEAITSTFASATTRYMGANTDYVVTGQAGDDWYYRVLAYNDAGKGPVSNIEFVTVTLSTIGATDVAPIDNLDMEREFTVAWDEVLSATSYILEESANSYFIDPVVIYSGPLTETTVTDHVGGTWYYRARAIGDTDQGPWGDNQSTMVMTVVFLPLGLNNYEIDRGFNSQFTDHTNGWVTHLGTWTLSGGSYQTKGVPQYASSISFDRNFTKFDYQVRMFRSGCTICANRIMLHGTPEPLNFQGHWSKQYIFQYVMEGYFAVLQLVDGVATPLVDWTESSAINTGAAWNTIRAVSVDGMLYFYINGSLEAWGALDPTLTSGRVGVGMYRDTADPSDLLMVDWATLTTIVSSTSATASEKTWVNDFVDPNLDQVFNPDYFIP